MTVIVNNEKISNVKFILQEKDYINIIYGGEYWALSRLIDNKIIDNKNINLKVVA